MNRDFSKLNVTVSLDGFDGHLQIEYNRSPVGPYQGPYDQNEALDLSIQLPDSDLDFRKYTEFRHSDTLECKRFSITENYNDVEDLNKIDALKISDEEDEETDGDDESDNGDEFITPVSMGNAQFLAHALHAALEKNSVLIIC